MKLKRYVELIENHYPFLINQFNYKLVFKEQEGFYKLHVGLASTDHQARFFFVKESGGGGVPLIGPSTASFYTIYHEEWIGLVPLLYFLGAEPIRWEKADTKAEEFEQAHEDMLMISDRVEPRVEQILDMFKSDDRIQQWKPTFNEFLEKRSWAVSIKRGDWF